MIAAITSLAWLLPLAEEEEVTESWVVGIIVDWLIGQIEDFVIAVGEVFGSAYQAAIEDPLVTAGLAAEKAFRIAGTGVLDAERAVVDALKEIGMSSGLAAPFAILIMMVLTAFIVVGLAWSVRLIIGLVIPP